jgi:TonB family protein
MDRLQKKCAIASAGVHLLLILIVAACPAFVKSKAPERLAQVDFLPSMFVDSLVSGGGNPNAQRSQPQITLPSQPVLPPPQNIVQPPPEPVKPREKVVEPELKHTPEPEPDLSEHVVKRHKPDVSTTPIVRKPSAEKLRQDKEKAEAQRLAQANAETNRRKQLAAILGGSASALSRNLNGATKIEGDPGPGGGGPAYANYAAWVQSVYEGAWDIPDDLNADEVVTKVRVVIASDGTVVSARIISASGDSATDRSVQRAIDRVKSIAPFPEGSKDKERSYIIKFSPKLKRGLA